MTPNRYSILKNVTYRLLRIPYTNTINIDRPYEDLDIFIFVSKYSYLGTYLKLIAYSAGFFTRGHWKETYFRGNSRSLCSRFRKCLLFPFGLFVPFTITSPTKRPKWRRNPQGLASCGRNERTEGLSHWIRLLTTPISTEVEAGYDSLREDDFGLSYRK